MKDHKGQEVCTTDGRPGEQADVSLKENGQQKDYRVLCTSERAKGFIRPYRDQYKHLTCGGVTTMGKALSETYARDPSFYDGTFCCNCGTHFPLNEFRWTADGEVVGS